MEENSRGLDSITKPIQKKPERLSALKKEDNHPQIFFDSLEKAKKDQEIEDLANDAVSDVGSSGGRG